MTASGALWRLMSLLVRLCIHGSVKLKAGARGRRNALLACQLHEVCRGCSEAVPQS